MGMYTTYRRVPALLLEQWRATHNQPAARFYMGQDIKQFPYSIQHLQLRSDVDVHGLLNPDDTADSLLGHVVEGGIALSADHTTSGQIYLGLIYFLTPHQVREIASVLTTFDFNTIVRNFAKTMDLADQQPQTAFQHPMFTHAYRQFEHILCFFQIAAEADDGILRRTS